MNFESLNNIRSVSKYESKLLIRSWFFKIFTILAILILGILNISMLVSDDGGGLWPAKTITSNIAYLNLLLLNTGQAVIAIFLASDFLKRDKKLDTSEVFYVRPLSNAEYVTGKIWGNLRVFLILNLIIMSISLIFSLTSPGIKIDWMSYPIYFLLISIPTLIYIIGLSIFLMLVLKNQAVTFILLLGYIGLTLFYINDKYYYLFDYMAYHLPLMKSSIVGFTNLDALLTHRAIYLFAGLGFIFITISLFRRLPNSPRSNYPWLLLALCMFVVSGMSGYRHIHSILEQGRLRTLYTDINNKYVHTARMVINHYDISVEQHPGMFTAVVTMKGAALQTSPVFTFCLNPGLEVQEITTKDKPLDFQRDRQIILVDFGKEITAGDTVSFTIKYAGKVDGNFCYLDIPEEVLQKQYKYFLFNADKQYSFQTRDYLLFTPETYWYPHPGTAYSSESADWQQMYFSQFKLRVKPLSGLIPLSQGKGLADENGVYTFSPEYPTQAISLAVGKYRENTIEADSIRYSIWYIEGHDYYTAAFDSIRDTIPTLVRNVKEELERTYKLEYQFKRFSIVEVPAQFYCYPHGWSQAQEAVQPEMVLFTEKGWLFDQMDVIKKKKDQMKWAKWNGQEIDEEESEIRTFNDAIRLFIRPEGNHDYSSKGRGEYNIIAQANPYFQFPQLYNFRYNIFSPEWPVANRIIELYLQNKQDSQDWEREINGISNNEKANLLMEKQSFRELLTSVEYRYLFDNIVSLKANHLFSVPEVNMGIDKFRTSVYSVLKENTFRNIRFENLLDTLGQIGQANIKLTIPEWEHPTPLPFYSIGQPEVTKVVNRGQETFIMNLQVSNDSDYDGIIQLNIQAGNRQNQIPDPRTNRKILLPARQSKQLVTLWDDEPREVRINTMISGNLPTVINQPVRNIKQERGKSTEKEDDYIVTGSSFDVWSEVVVDNEDSLFQLSEPIVMGLLPKWLNKTADTSFKYSGIPQWRGAPLQWAATTNAGYYGKYIRSAYVIKSGNGSQTATWKVPVPTEGHYEVYYYVFKDKEIKHDNRPDIEYRFRVEYGEETEDAYINLNRANEGWEQLGVYYFGSDTVRIVLSNESKLQKVTADAVKIVKR